MELDLEWEPELAHRVGGAKRLGGINVFHDFPWLDVFTDERTQFRNGKCLAAFVKQKCPADKTPALLLTRDSEVVQGIRQTDNFWVYVVNIDEYRGAESDAALSYLASHLELDIADITELRELVEGADPQIVRSFIESSLDIEHVAEWALDNPERIKELRDLVAEAEPDASKLADALAHVASLSEVSSTDISAMATFFATSTAGNLGDLFKSPEVSERLYNLSPDAFRAAIQSDPAATDVIALNHRKAVVERFRILLSDSDVFAEAKSEHGGRPEAVWQSFLEESPWILGIGLSGQLLTSWNNERLEQVVAGFSVTGPGKRADALLRTAGRIRSLAFAEIKHHETPLLGGSEYRPGCWAPSSELAGGIAQSQQTAHLAVREIGERLTDLDEDGAETGEATWVIRPRSFLILGHLDQLRGGAGVQLHKLRSFELCRRHLDQPEVLTFDELLARAEWHVSLAEHEL